MAGLLVFGAVAPHAAPVINPQASALSLSSRGSTDQCPAESVAESIDSFCIIGCGAAYFVCVGGAYTVHALVVGTAATSRSDAINRALTNRAGCLLLAADGEDREECERNYEIEEDIAQQVYQAVVDSADEALQQALTFCTLASALCVASCATSSSAFGDEFQCDTP